MISNTVFAGWEGNATYVVETTSQTTENFDLYPYHKICNPEVQGVFTGSLLVSKVMAPFLDRLGHLAVDPLNMGRRLSGIMPNSSSAFGGIVDVTDIVDDQYSEGFLQTHALVVAAKSGQQPGCRAMAGFILGECGQASTIFLPGTHTESRVLPIFEGNLLAGVGDPETLGLILRMIREYDIDPRNLNLHTLMERVGELATTYERKDGATGAAILHAFRKEMLVAPKPIEVITKPSDSEPSDIVIHPQLRAKTAPLGVQSVDKLKQGAGWFLGRMYHSLDDRIKSYHRQYKQEGVRFPRLCAYSRFTADAAIAAAVMGGLLGTLAFGREIASNKSADVCSSTCNNAAGQR